VNIPQITSYAARDNSCWISWGWLFYSCLPYVCNMLAVCDKFFAMGDPFHVIYTVQIRKRRLKTNCDREEWENTEKILIVNVKSKSQRNLPFASPNSFLKQTKWFLGILSENQSLGSVNNTYVKQCIRVISIFVQHVYMIGNNLFLCCCDVKRE